MTDTHANLVNDLLNEYWNDHPEAASAVGRNEYAGRLRDYSADGFEADADKAKSWLARFEAEDAASLTPDEAIDRDLIISELRGTLAMADWQVWKRNPDKYLSPTLGSIFNLLLHRSMPEPELAEAVASRLRQIPDALRAGEANLDPSMAHPLFIERASGMCAAGARYSRDIVPGEVDPGARDEVATAGAAAADAFEAFGAHLGKLLPDAAGPYAIGADRYSAVLQEQEMLGYGAEEMRERGRAELERIASEMRKRAKALRGTEDFVAVMRELNADHPATPEDMRVAYAEWTERARQFLVDHDLVTLPEGEVCKVVPSPVFQRPVLAVASYMSPPMLTGDRTGHFFVPFPPDGVSDAEIAERLESNSYSVIPTVSVHEAYPGHHWHLTSMTLNPSIPRRIFGSSYFAEGWALYVEMMMLDEGLYDDPAHELGVFDARIFRAVRIVVDTSLHIGDMDFDQALAFLMEHTGMAEPTARAEIGRYCSWPTQAPSYLTGCLEIERMRDDWVGSGKSLKEFHDRMGRSGTLPIALAERALHV